MGFILLLVTAKNLDKIVFEMVSKTLDNRQLRRVVTKRQKTNELSYNCYLTAWREFGGS